MQNAMPKSLFILFSKTLSPRLSRTLHVECHKLCVYPLSFCKTQILKQVSSTVCERNYKTYSLVFSSSYANQSSTKPVRLVTTSANWMSRSPCAVSCYAIAQGLSQLNIGVWDDVLAGRACRTPQWISVMGGMKVGRQEAKYSEKNVLSRSRVKALLRSHHCNS
jgi:hypothetical protein